MSLLNSKVQRILFIVGVLAAILIIIKSTIWAVQPGNSLYRNSLNIPYQSDLIQGRYEQNSVIEVSKTCKWMSGSKANQKNIDESAIISRDTLYLINLQCLFGNAEQSIIAPKRCSNLFDEYLSSQDQFSSNEVDLEISCDQLYINYAMTFSPLFSSPSKKIDFSKEKVGKCLLTSEMLCVEAKKNINFKLWNIIKSDKILLIAFAIFMICLIGVIFFSAIIKIWQITFVRLIAWIKDGR